LTHNAIQRLLLKRFALAAGTYALALLLRQRADQALYRAKRDGRNRCAAAWENVDA
jgi:GGDEF domain-containing protein